MIMGAPTWAGAEPDIGDWSMLRLGFYKWHIPTAAIAAIAVLAATPYAAANDWDNGSGDAAWSNPINWSGNIEPNSGTSALFPAGFPNGDTNIILSPGEAAVLLSVGDNYTFRNFIPTLDDATLTLADGVVHVVGGKTATIHVRLFSNNRLSKIGAGAASLLRATTTDGDVHVDVGTLNIRSTLSCLGGSIAEVPGSIAVVTVDGPGARWILPGAPFGGLLSFGAGTGTLNIAGGGQVQVSYALLGDSAGSAATVNVSGTGSALSTFYNIYLGSGGATSVLNVTGGTVSVDENIEGGNGLSTLTLDGGTLDMTNDLCSSCRRVGSADFPITNLNFRGGTLRNVSEINGGAGLTKTTAGTLILEGANTYTGPTTVSAGTLKLSGSGSFASSPIISLAEGTTLDVAEVSSGLNFNGTSFSLAAGQTLVGSGNVNGPMGVGAGSSITIGASESLTLSNDADIDAGTVSVEGGSLTAPNIVNNGTLNITAGAITTPGVLGAGNDGTLDGGAGAGSVSISGGSVSARAVLLGSAVGGTGDLTVSGAGELTTNKLAANALTVDGGTVTVLDEPVDPPDPVLDRSMVAGYVRDGALALNAGTITTPNIKLGITAGMTGTYTQTGGTLSAGSIALGDTAGGIGEFRWSGGALNAQSLDMTGPATLGVSLAGDTLGSGYAQLQVSGNAALAGTLEIARTDGFEPSVEQSFIIMTYSSHTGTFENVTGLSAGPGLVFQVQYNPGDVTLVVTPAAPGDCDADGDVDPDDYVDFVVCLNGPGGGTGSGCECTDFDGDGDADLLDFAEFQTLFTD
jgi:autotransporter-associated beta strand protein/T5SS/PEP-CTERM-associated repeat protein